MNLLDLRKFTFALFVIKFNASSLLIPFFSPNKLIGFNKLKILLKASLKIVTLTLSPLFLSLPFNLASENSLFPSNFTLFILTFLFFSTVMSSLMLLATTESSTSNILTFVLKNPFLL